MKKDKFDYNQFYINVTEDLDKTNSFIYHIEIEEMNEEFNHHNPNYYNEELITYKEQLKIQLEFVKLKFDFAYEYLGLEKMSSLLNKELEEYKGRYEKLLPMFYDEGLYSPIKVIFYKHLEALTSHICITENKNSERISSIELLEQILKGTPKILTDQKIEPKNESEVRKVVYDILIHIFPDTVREVSIAKVSKTYKPDIGIKQLKCAIEYKFIDTFDEAKTTIGGIFEDISGYEGSQDWESFYAVFYMTDQFLTQAQVEAEFKLSNVPSKWKPIIVYGKGDRKNKITNKK